MEQNYTFNWYGTYLIHKCTKTLIVYQLKIEAVGWLGSSVG